jgi:hypothetical protein
MHKEMNTKCCHCCAVPGTQYCAKCFHPYFTHSCKHLLNNCLIPILQMSYYIRFLFGSLQMNLKENFFFFFLWQHWGLNLGSHTC